MFPVLPGVRALILEDDSSNRLLLTYVLEDHGAVVTATSRIESALMKLQSEEFDLAVVDYHVGGECSDAVIEALEAKTIPFVIATGSTQSVKLVGPDKRATIMKPYATHELIDGIRMAIEAVANKKQAGVRA